jgi:hypothetical protein
VPIRRAFDQTPDGHNLKLLHGGDDFTPRRSRSSVGGGPTPHTPWRRSRRLVTERGSTPAFVPCDNRPELTANALRGSCRFSKAGNGYIEPGSPWQNPFVESFGSRIRDELLAVELFSCLAEALGEETSRSEKFQVENPANDGMSRSP